ncbi:DUF481 domain-containing protein [Saprospiraceae bacterium]|nr:DUF481 domain-containing protein [Saprospiraceae bacterium]
MLRIVLFTIIAFFQLQTISAQLVNIESKRMQTDTVRFVLKNNFSLGYNNNNGDYIFQISNGLATQAKSKDLRKIFLFIGDYSLIKSENADFRNSLFFHLRFNYKISNLYRFETFLQNQSNKLLDIKSRNLAGLGLRLKLISKPNTKLYLGNAYMYEIEKSVESNMVFNNHRHSSYLSLTAVLPKSKVTIINTIYFQPLYINVSDFRILEQFKIEIPLSKGFNLSSTFNYFYNNLTPTTKETQFASHFKMGLGIEI